MPKLSEAQKFLQENNYDDLVIKNRLNPDPDAWRCVSDAMMEFKEHVLAQWGITDEVSNAE